MPGNLVGIVGSEKKRAQENVERLLSILECLYAKQIVTMKIGGKVLMRGSRVCYYDRWMSITDWYFKRFPLKIFLSELKWEEWYEVSFKCFFEDCMKEYATFGMDLVWFSMEKMKKLRDKLSMVPEYCVV